MQPSLMPSTRVLAISQCRRVAAEFLFRLEMPAQVPEVGRVRFIVRGRSVSNLMKDSLLLFKCFLSGLKNVSADVKNGAIRGGHNPVGVGAIVDLCLGRSVGGESEFTSKLTISTVSTRLRRIDAERIRRIEK
jgi:hypothetical protein